MLVAEHSDFERSMCSYFMATVYLGDKSNDPSWLILAVCYTCSHWTDASHLAAFTT